MTKRVVLALVVLFALALAYFSLRYDGPQPQRPDRASADVLPSPEAPV